MFSLGPVIVWALLLQGPTYYMHAGEYMTRESCIKAGNLLTEHAKKVDVPKSAMNWPPHFGCWPMRKLMEN